MGDDHHPVDPGRQVQPALRRRPRGKNKRIFNTTQVISGLLINLLLDFVLVVCSFVALSFINNKLIITLHKISFNLSLKESRYSLMYIKSI